MRAHLTKRFTPATGTGAFVFELGIHGRSDGLGPRRPPVQLFATITEPAPDEPWEYLTGFVDATFVKNHVLADLATAIIYVAGPETFVAAMAKALASAGADPDNVRMEEFAGY